MLSYSMSDHLAQPFLHWPGGKRYLLEEILSRFPCLDDVDTYVEPFLGGGAVFFGLRAAGWDGLGILADKHEGLIQTYRAVQLQENPVIKAIRELESIHYGSDYYYHVRARWNREMIPPHQIDLFGPRAYTELDAPTRAACMIYLSWCGFNGLWRENRAGKQNVAVGTRGKKSKIDLQPAVDAVVAASRALRHADLVAGEFSQTVLRVRRMIRKGLADPTRIAVYFDPPYDDAADRSTGFTSYTAGGFSPAARRTLEVHARELAELGCGVVISDNWTPFVLDLYSEWQVDRVEVPRRISRDGQGRAPVPEALITWGGWRKESKCSLPLWQRSREEKDD